MPKAELIYDADCPNVESARNALREALTASGLPPIWKEWNRSNSESPAYASRYGSPTILVDGQDVAGQGPGDAAASCRVYTDSAGRIAGVPSVQAIRHALAGKRDKRNHWVQTLAVLPSLGASVLPIGACPACWPAYAGLLSALGLGFLLESAYLLPVTVLFFGIALASLGYRAQSRRGYKPLLLGLGAAAVALIGKFALTLTPLLHFGLGLLVAASVWNSWPRKAASPASCAACATRDDGTQSLSA